MVPAAWISQRRRQPRTPRCSSRQRLDLLLAADPDDRGTQPQPGSRDIGAAAEAAWPWQFSPGVPRPWLGRRGRRKPWLTCSTETKNTYIGGMVISGAIHVRPDLEQCQVSYRAQCLERSRLPGRSRPSLSSRLRWPATPVVVLLLDRPCPSPRPRSGGLAGRTRPRAPAWLVAPVTIIKAALRYSRVPSGDSGDMSRTAPARAVPMLAGVAFYVIVEVARAESIVSYFVRGEVVPQC